MHPNLDEAQKKLREALAALERAPDIFGGHKANAIRMIEEADLEINQAETYHKARTP